MEFKNVSISLKNSRLLQTPLNHHPRDITIDPNEGQAAEVMLICYKIHLLGENSDVFAYLLKNINPTGIWYERKVRDGDRLISLNGQDTTRMSFDDVHTIMSETKFPFTCQLVWHPELYIELGTNLKEDDSIRSPRLIGDPIYGYFTDIIRNLLDYRPKEPYQLIKKQEETSNDIETELYPLAQRQLTLLSNRSTIEGNPEDTMRNLLEENILFERIGIGLNSDEIYWIWLSMKALLNEKPNIQKLRFWGKIFGLNNNYYIAEVDFDTFDNLDLNDSEFLKYQQAFSPEEEEDETNDTNIHGKVPPESIGQGVNQKVFYASQGIDKSFVQLPLLTPEQIELSRKIQQFFTGDLEAPVRCDLSFPGVEKHILRAQIQRISAGTQIAPKNYLKNPINEEEQMGEESLEDKINLDMNNQLEDLALSDGQYWRHCVPYINQQGRNENSANEIDAFYLNKEQGRTSIPPKSVDHHPTIDQDMNIAGLHAAWSVGIASTLVPEYTLVYVRSNRWPGAFTIGDRHRFENIYIGWGVKNFLENHYADMIDTFPENEYKYEMIEIDDPTVDEENELFQTAILLSPDENEEFEMS